MIFIYLFISYVFCVYILGLHSCSSKPAVSSKVLLATHQLYSQSTVTSQMYFVYTTIQTNASIGGASAFLVNQCSSSPAPPLPPTHAIDFLHKSKDNSIYISPHRAMTTSVVGLSRIVLQFSIFRTTFILSPSSSVTTFPNTTCFPSRNGVGQDVMKN